MFATAIGRCAAALLLAGAVFGGTVSFPSASSTVIGSVGFVNAVEIGYFWSAARGDSVVETFADPIPSVSSLDLHLFVPTNVLSVGYSVVWDVRLNGSSVGGFTVLDGVTGPLNYSYLFAPISSPGNYTIGLFVMNQVPEGAGSHTFAYTKYPHSAELGVGDGRIPEPSSLILLTAGAGFLWAIRRRLV